MVCRAQLPHYQYYLFMEQLGPIVLAALVSTNDVIYSHQKCGEGTCCASCLLGGAQVPRIHCQSCDAIQHVLAVVCAVLQKTCAGSPRVSIADYVPLLTISAFRQLAGAQYAWHSTT